MPKKLDFKDFLAVDYKPGSDGLIKKNAKKRKQDIPTGNTGESYVPERKLSQAELDKREEIAKAIERENPGMDMSKKMAIATAQAKKSVDEALDVAARRKLSRQMKRLAPRIKIAKKRALKRTASIDKIRQRAKKQARNEVFKKLAKGKSKGDLTFQRRSEIEKRLKRLEPRIEKMARKMIPKVRKMDRDRKSRSVKEEKYCPQKHEWGKAAAAEYARKLTPGEKKEKKK